MKSFFARLPSSALRGALIALFGVLLLVWQTPTLSSVVLAFGGVLLAWGAVATLLSLSNRERPRWWLTLAEGVLSVGVGLFVFVEPGTSALLLVSLLAAWGLIGALTQVVRPEVRNAPLPLLLYGVSIGVGVSLLVMGASAFFYVWFVGVYALFVGAVPLFSSLRARRAPKAYSRPATL